MTAMDSYYRAISETKIPGTIMVQDGEGHTGLATQSAPVIGNAAAEGLAFSADPKKRAEAAIMVCAAATEAIDRFHPSLDPVAA